MDTALVQCPYCFETIEVYFEADVDGEFVQDCEVCCNPWTVRVYRDPEGALSVEISRAQ